MNRKSGIDSDSGIFGRDREESILLAMNRIFKKIGVKAKRKDFSFIDYYKMTKGMSRLNRPFKVPFNMLENPSKAMDLMLLESQ